MLVWCRNQPHLVRVELGLDGRVVQRRVPRLARRLGQKEPFVGMLTPLAIRIGAIAWMPKLLPQITWLDKQIQRSTRGRWSILRIAGLPNLMLTVKGRKSGAPRTTPLLCVPYENDYLIAGSYFGGPTTPIWVGNVRAADTVTVSVRGESHAAIPIEIGDDERERAWAHMVKTWPNFAKYAERTSRKIPIFLLKRTDQT